jgi:FkbM family methyltransferase
MLLRKNLNRLPNYVKRFGVFRGTALFFKVYCTSEGLLLPGYPHPIELRRTASDTSTFFQVLVKEEYHPEGWPQYDQLRSQYRDIVAAGRQPLIIDAGGNIGLAAIWFAKAFPGARIVTIEPDQENLVILKSNVASYKNIAVLEGGLWQKAARLQIDNPGEGSAGFRVSEALDGPIEGYSVPEILERQQNAELFIVKIDIEGAEQHVFQGDLEWCRKARMITIETHDWLLPRQGTSHSFWRCVATLEADILFRGENVFVFNS